MKDQSQLYINRPACVLEAVRDMGRGAWRRYCGRNHHISYLSGVIELLIDRCQQPLLWSCLYCANCRSYFPVCQTIKQDKSSLSCTISVRLIILKFLYKFRLFSMCCFRNVIFKTFWRHLISKFLFSKALLFLIDFPVLSMTLYHSLRHLLDSPNHRLFVPPSLSLPVILHCHSLTELHNRKQIRNRRDMNNGFLCCWIL